MKDSHILCSSQYCFAVTTFVLTNNNNGEKYVMFAYIFAKTAALTFYLIFSHQPKIIRVVKMKVIKTVFIYYFIIVVYMCMLVSQMYCNTCINCVLYKNTFTKHKGCGGSDNLFIKTINHHVYYSELNSMYHTQSIPDVRHLAEHNI